MTGPSHLDLLRARYRQLATAPKATLYLPVKFGVSDGPEGEVGLVVEYRQPDWLETQKLDQKYATRTDEFALRDSAAEQLALCCVDVWSRDDEQGQALTIGGRPAVRGKWLPGLGADNGKVGFTRAAKLLELSADDGLQAVVAVLRDDWQVMDHLEKLASFEPLPPVEVGDFVGESQAETDSAI